MVNGIQNNEQYREVKLENLFTFSNKIKDKGDGQ